MITPFVITFQPEIHQRSRGPKLSLPGDDVGALRHAERRHSAGNRHRQPTLGLFDRLADRERQHQPRRAVRLSHDPGHLLRQAGRPRPQAGRASEKLELVGGKTYSRNAANKFVEAKLFDFAALGSKYEATKK